MMSIKEVWAVSARGFSEKNPKHSLYSKHFGINIDPDTGCYSISKKKNLHFTLCEVQILASIIFTTGACDPI